MAWIIPYQYACCSLKSNIAKGGVSKAYVGYTEKSVHTTIEMPFGTILTKCRHVESFANRWNNGDTLGPTAFAPRFLKGYGEKEGAFL